MAQGYWFLLPLGAAFAAPLACSSTDTPKNSPAPPTPIAGSSNGGGSGGAMTQGGSGGNTSSGTGGGGDGTCKAADCPDGGFCKMGMCACSADKPEVCMGANVGGGPTGVCTSRMTDANNCGECGMKCEAGAACVAGVCGAKPTDVATSAGCGSMRLAIQGTSIYWTEKMSGKVMSAPLAGGAPVEVATGQKEPTQIAADAKGVYWVNQGDATVGSSAVMKKALPIAAGAPITLKASPDAIKLLTLVVGGDMLYYSHEHDIHAISTDEEETDDVIVGTAINFDLSPPDGEPAGEPAGLALKGTKLFWTTATRQGVEGDDTAVGHAGYTELGESQGSLLLQDMATDGTNGYWVDGANFRRAVKKPPIDVAGTPDFDMITAFAINDKDVYFVGANGQVFQHTLTPPATPEMAVAPTALARDQKKTSSIALDATKAYWASDCVIRSTPLGP